MKRTMLILSIFLLATLISGWVNLAEAQQAGKVYRIGVLGGCSIVFLGSIPARATRDWVRGRKKPRH